MDSMLPLGAPPQNLSGTIDRNNLMDVARHTSRQGMWHAGHAICCVWGWVWRHWPVTGPWSATWAIQWVGQQQAEALTSQNTPDNTNPITTPNLCPLCATHQILAYHKDTNPTIHIEVTAHAARTAFVSEVLPISADTTTPHLSEMPWTTARSVKAIRIRLRTPPHTQKREPPNHLRTTPGTHLVDPQC